MTKSTIRAVVVGASGYSGQELLRLLLRHPHVEIVAITSRQYAGKKLAEVYPVFAQVPGSELEFTVPEMADLLKADADVYFLALPHGVAAEFALPLVESGRRVIDISADFRLRDAAVYREFYGHEHPAPGLLAGAVYGLPEVYGERIREARLVASAGCYPTSILLPLIPLLREKLVEVSPIFVSSSSGTTGAGRKADETLLFSEVTGSLRAYGIPKHRHLSEIEQELSFAAGQRVVVTFVPHLVPIARGIHTTIFCMPAKDGVKEEELLGCLREAYRGRPFVRVRSSNPDTKDVCGSNFCDMTVKVDGRAGAIVVLSAVDNLTKGASGQAIQAMNWMFGLPEECGLL